MQMVQGIWQASPWSVHPALLLKNLALHWESFTSFCSAELLTMLPHLLSYMQHVLVQQLYMLGGLLCNMAILNSMPVRIVAKVAYIGAAWHVIRETLTLTIDSCSVQNHRLRIACYIPLYHMHA